MVYVLYSSQSNLLKIYIKLCHFSIKNSPVAPIQIQIKLNSSFAIEGPAWSDSNYISDLNRYSF